MGNGMRGNDCANASGGTAPAFTRVAVLRRSAFAFGINGWMSACGGQLFLIHHRERKSPAQLCLTGKIAGDHSDIDRRVGWSDQTEERLSSAAFEARFFNNLSRLSSKCCESPPFCTQRSTTPMVSSGKDT
jgi:hypothetical protein